MAVGWLVGSLAGWLAGGWLVAVGWLVAYFGCLFWVLILLLILDAYFGCLFWCSCWVLILDACFGAYFGAPNAYFKFQQRTTRNNNEQ